MDSTYPSAGIDRFRAKATMNLEIPGGASDTFDLAGVVEVRRGDPFDSGDGIIEIPMEVISLRMEGISALVGRVEITEEPVGVSGFIRQQKTGVDFPAMSCTRPHHAIRTAIGQLANRSDFVMCAMINSIPPYGDTYTLQGDPIELVSKENLEGSTLGLIRGVALTALVAAD